MTFHKKDPTHLSSIRRKSKRAIIPPVRREAKPLPYYRSIGREIRPAHEPCSLSIILRLARVGALREHGDDISSVEFDGLGLEVTEGERFIKVGAIDALEGTDSLRGDRVVVVRVWKSAALCTCEGSMMGC